MSKPKNGNGQQLAVQEPSVAMMLQKVIDGGITSENVSALDALVGLYDRMQAKDAEKQFAVAFSKLQSQIQRIEAIHPVPDRHGSVKYRVAKFEEVWDEVEPRLLEHGFTASFSQKYEEGMPLRVTQSFILQHTASGHKTVTPFTVRVGSGPPGCTEYQADGAASSYAKMRALCSSLNIIIQDSDDDARMIGKPIGRALGEELRLRVKQCGADEQAFLKFAGVACSNPAKPEDYSEIPDDRFDALDAMLTRKERGQPPRAGEEKKDGQGYIF